MPVSFDGRVYAKTDTASSDAVRKFETSEMKLAKATLQAKGAVQSIGSHVYDNVYGNIYTYPLYLYGGQTMDLINVDLNKLCFANFTAGANGTVSIVGVYG